MRYAYQWRAYYESDSWLDEYSEAPCVSANGEHPGEHAFACIDKSRLTGLAWLDGGGAVWAQVAIKPFTKAILFRRHKVEDVLGVLGDPVRSVIHVIGWETQGQWLLAIMPDGRVVMTDDQRDLG